MDDLEKRSRKLLEQAKKFEKAAHAIHEMADAVHKKMEKLHLKAKASSETARRVRSAIKESGENHCRLKTTTK
jgi:methyl-accepting chemotaxis protein